MNYRKLLGFPQKWVAQLINNPMTWLGAAASLPFMGALTALAITQEQTLPQPAAPLAQQVTEQLTLPALPTTQASGLRYWRDEAVQRGDTIARLLNRLGVDDGEATRFIHASPLSRDLLKLRTGATLSVDRTGKNQCHRRLGAGARASGGAYRLVGDFCRSVSAD